MRTIKLSVALGVAAFACTAYTSATVFNSSNAGDSEQLSKREPVGVVASAVVAYILVTLLTVAEDLYVGDGTQGMNLPDLAGGTFQVNISKNELQQCSTRTIIRRATECSGVLAQTDAYAITRNMVRHNDLSSFHLLLSVSQTLQQFSDRIKYTSYPAQIDRVVEDPRFHLSPAAEHCLVNLIKRKQVDGTFPFVMATALLCLWAFFRMVEHVTRRNAKVKNDALAIASPRARKPAPALLRDDKTKLDLTKCSPRKVMARSRECSAHLETTPAFDVALHSLGDDDIDALYNAMMHVSSLAELDEHVIDDATLKSKIEAILTSSHFALTPAAMACLGSIHTLCAP